MARRPTGISKKEIRQMMHLTRPPRLEGTVKNARMDPVRKKKKVRNMPVRTPKTQGYSEQQRKNYHLKSKS